MAAARWLTAGSGLLRGRVPDKAMFAAPGATPATSTPFDQTGALAPPAKGDAFGDDGAFTGGTIGKTGMFADSGAFGTPGKGGFGDLSSLAIQESTAIAAQQPPPPGAGLNAGIGGPVPGAGGIGQAGGEFSVLNQYDTAFQSAAAKFGLPANVLKAIAMIERGWEGSGVSPSGAVGIMQVMPQYWGNKGYDIYSLDGNIMAGALAYKSFYDQYKDEAMARGMDPYVAAARAYLAGNPWSGASDDFGTTTDIYGKRFTDYLNQLGGGAFSGGSGGGGSLSMMFGTDSVPDWGGFNLPSGNGLYGYGTQYGLDGSSHTGLDIPLNLNSPMRAAFSGTVVCAGTNRGNGMDSCAAFNDYYGGGAGRIQIMSDDGNTMLIYGHSSRSAVSPGQRVNAGDLVGYSGGQNSPHVHLEARVRDSSMPSGWRLVDPRTVLGGGGVTYVPAGAPSGGGYPSYGQRMIDILRGM